ncbi:MAG: hypothetical protein RL716_13 [Actinomycetota bacterium]
MTDMTNTNWSASAAGKALSLRNKIVASVFALAFFGLAIAIAWPIYQVAYFLVSVGSAVILGAFIAWMRLRFKLSIVTTILVSLVTYLLVGAPLTNPESLSSIPSFLAGWVESVSGLLFGWKQLVTIDLPVGSYHALLVPAFSTFFIASIFVFAIFNGPAKRYWSAVIPFIAVTIFGLAFGSTTIEQSLNLFGLELSISVGLATGLALLALSIAYLSWGAKALRGSALVSSDTASEARSEARVRGLRRLLSAAAVLLVASLIGGFGLNIAGVPVIRDALRSGTHPRVLDPDEISPLSSYRRYFGQDSLEQTLLTYSTEGTAPERIRLSVMSFFDGKSLRVAPETDGFDASGVFSRVPTDLASQTGSGETTVTTFKLAPEYDRIWVPMVDNIKNVKFAVGETAAAQSNAFFMNRSMFAGLLNDKTLVPGATYTVESYLLQSPLDATEVIPSSNTNIDKSLIPDSLNDWLEAQQISVTDASGLVELAKRLRARGYLSHSLQEPEDATKADWTASLSGYTFVASLAGHNIGRIDKMFTALNERELTAPSKTDKNLVAAVGDDEQFATALALIATNYGFETRVVVGFRTQPTADGAYAVEECVDGECKGKNLTAWVEVAGSDGRWFAIDSTPQYQNKIAPKSSKQSPPKHSTDVIDDSASELPPAQVDPAAGESDNAKTQEEFDFGPIWAVISLSLQVTGALLLLIGPFALVIGAKAFRRRDRRDTPFPDLAVVGAWEEYFDTKLDFGFDMPKNKTRPELAEAFGTEDAEFLAMLADVAAFAPFEPSEDHVAEAWAIVDAERAALKKQSSFAKRVKAQLSLKSFLVYINPSEQISKLQSTIERKVGVSDYSGSPWLAYFRFIKKGAASRVNSLKARTETKLKKGE